MPKKFVQEKLPSTGRKGPSLILEEQTVSTVSPLGLGHSSSKETKKFSARKVIKKDASLSKLSRNYSIEFIESAHNTVAKNEKLNEGEVKQPLSPGP